MSNWEGIIGQGEEVNRRMTNLFFVTSDQGCYWIEPFGYTGNNFYSWIKTEPALLVLAPKEMSYWSDENG